MTHEYLTPGDSLALNSNMENNGAEDQVLEPAGAGGTGITDVDMLAAMNATTGMVAPEQIRNLQRVRQNSLLEAEQQLVYSRSPEETARIAAAKAQWQAIDVEEVSAEMLARRGAVPSPNLSKAENIQLGISILTEKTDRGLSQGSIEWIDQVNVPGDIQSELANFKDVFARDGGKVSTGYISSLIGRLDEIMRQSDISANDPQIKRVYDNLRNLQKLRFNSENGDSREQQEVQNAVARAQERRGTSENPYDPPRSIEDLLEENVKIMPIEYRDDGEKAIMYEEEIENKLGEKIKVKRVNFENFIRYVHERADARGAISPRDPIDYFSVLKLRFGYNSYTLQDLLLYDETATLFLPKRDDNETDIHYRARIAAHKQVRDNLSSDLWIRQSARQKHMTIEYSGALGSDTDLPKELLKVYNDNVFTRSDDFEKHMNMSTALSYSPVAMEQRIKCLMDIETATTDEAKAEAQARLDDIDDRINGMVFRRGVSTYARINDFNAFVKVMGGLNSAFFAEKISSKIPKEFIKNASKIANLEDSAEWKSYFRDGKFSPNTLINGQSIKAKFIDNLNIFNAADKSQTLIDAVQERFICALAEKAYVRLEAKYKDEFIRRYGDNYEKELWKNAFEAAHYEHEDAYYWTSFTGLNTGDNDPRATAFRAKSKPDNMFAYFNKQLSTDRGQFPGNQYIMSGTTRMSTHMLNAIETEDGRSIMDTFEGRELGGDTSEFNFDNKVEKLTFAREAMSYYADNHIRRVFKLFNDIVDAKELGINSFITRDPSPFGEGRVIIDKAKAQDVFGKWKDWRYIFNQIPMAHKIRSLVGQDAQGNYLYKEMTIAEAFFTKDLLHDFLWDGKYSEGDVRAADGTKVVDGMTIKKGDIDPKKIASDKAMIWKAFCKYFIAAELYSHRQKNDPNAYYTFSEMSQIRGFLRTIPAAAMFGNTKEDISDRSMDRTKITGYFLDDEDMDWIEKTAHADRWTVNREGFLYAGAGGFLEGGWKFLILMLGASK